MSRSAVWVVWDQVVDGGLLPWFPLWFNSSPKALPLSSLVGFALAVVVLLLNWARMRHFASLPPPQPWELPAAAYGLPVGGSLRLPPWR